MYIHTLKVMLPSGGVGAEAPRFSLDARQGVIQHPAACAACSSLRHWGKRRRSCQNAQWASLKIVVVISIARYLPERRA